MWRWQLGRAQALFDGNGKIIAWFGEILQFSFPSLSGIVLTQRSLDLGTCTDVEEFMQLRTQLSETSKNLRRVIDLANVTLLCVDQNLKVLFLEGGGLLKREASTPESENAAGTPLMDVIPSRNLMQRAIDILNGQIESARVEVQIRREVWIICLVSNSRVLAHYGIEKVTDPFSVSS